MHPHRGPGLFLRTVVSIPTAVVSIPTSVTEFGLILYLLIVGVRVPRPATEPEAVLAGGGHQG